MNTQAKFMVSVGSMVVSTGALAADTVVGANECQPLTALQVAAGYVTPALALQTAAAVMASIFAIVFFGNVFKFLAGMFLSIPKIVYKVLGWSLSLGALVAPMWAPADMWAHLVFAGALGTSVMAGILFWDIFDKVEMRSRSASGTATLMALVGFVVYWKLGVAVDSGLTVMWATMAGIAGLYALYVLIMDPKSGSLQGGAALLMIVSVGVALLQVFGTPLSSIPFVMSAPADTWALQKLGAQTALWVGSLAVIIAALRWTSDRQSARYLIAQVAVFVAAGVLMAVGMSMDGAKQMLLTQAAGTVLIVYALTKPLDIPARNAISWSACGLIMCLGVYGLMRSVTTNPDFWGKYLMF